MFYYRKFFRIPSPTQLGMSSNDYAMPSRLFNDPRDGLTWEDYYERVKKEMPIRFFLSYTLFNFFGKLGRDILRPFKDTIYWLKCHLLASHRFHLVDLRDKDYRYGWMDQDVRMERAMVRCLTEFVEKEFSHLYIPTDEDVAQDLKGNVQYAGMANHRRDYDEIMTLYHYFTSEKAKDDAAVDQATHEWSDKRFSSSNETLWENLNQTEEEVNAKREAMLHRLLDIRHILWS